MSIYEKRRERIYDWMAREGIGLVMIEDSEARRNPGLRWLSGQPSDALLFLSVERKSLLVPWDINMAMLYAQSDVIIPYEEFELRPIKALNGAADYFSIPTGSRVEIPSTIPYPLFLKYVDEISDYDVLCRENGAGKELELGRAIKDEEEISIYRKLAIMTSDLTNLLEKNVIAGKIKTETDVALFIETEARKRGCEGTGFDTLAAGPSRSFGIHAFPNYTAGAFASQGLSILDYGLKYLGYTSDVTLTFAREPLSKQQEKMLSMVEKAYSIALSLTQKGARTRDIAVAVDTYFAKAKKHMPHGLGHGIGLQAHEAPAVSRRAENEWVLESGMIITLEPGLYDPVQGGCRLENDVLITDNGAEVLTNSRIIRL
ncbi:MAG: Xaa-Pro peptidase family protein [Treponema sp.]|jgi:Xaa-Pro dipeptidase|nr:Xaa-Pro peptidase family protein [Treponema sp.]